MRDYNFGYPGARWPLHSWYRPIGRFLTASDSESGGRDRIEGSMQGIVFSERRQHDVRSDNFSPSVQIPTPQAFT